MRILVVSMLYPPVAYGGYEVECSAVVERLRECHDVLVLTCEKDRGQLPDEPGVRRELALLTADGRGALWAPVAAVRAARSARRALAWKPDLIYVWNGSYIPQAALRVMADSGLALAFRVCEHWFGGLFMVDQFMRELLPAERGPARAMWAAGARGLNSLPSLRLNPEAPVRAAISWNSEAIKQMVKTPAFVDPVLERVCHSVPRYGDLYAAAVRDPSRDPNIMFVGRVTPYKGVSVAIEALALLRSKHELASAILTVVGPEEHAYGAQMRSLAEGLGVADAVSWLGPRTPDQVIELLSCASAMIVPSTWDEPFPLVTIEAAFARVPIVASDVGGVSEGMHDEEHALLFARGDAGAAAAALARTLHEGEQTAARVGRAFVRAQRMFGVGPYLDEQERFVADAYAALSNANWMAAQRR
jgi:glycosyltransferase involved in cell wall biosynthesis